MSTLEPGDAELRDALALWLQRPLTTDPLTQGLADLLKTRGAVPQPELPDTAAGEIHVASAFGAKPIRDLTYRPVNMTSHFLPSTYPRRRLRDERTPR